MKRKLRSWVKVLLLGIILVVLLSTVRNITVESRRENELKLVEQYTTCLKANATQRDYCARQMNQNYVYMDLMIKKYGYSYKQVGYDLYLVNSELVNK